MVRRHNKSEQDRDVVLPCDDGCDEDWVIAGARAVVVK
jgi:hypothetical protein